LIVKKKCVGEEISSYQRKDHQKDIGHGSGKKRS